MILKNIVILLHLFAWDQITTERNVDNILLEFTDQFMQSFTEEHYASVVYVNPNNVSDSFKRVHVDIITKTSRANTFMTYVRHMLRDDDKTLEPCMNHTRSSTFNNCKMTNRRCHFTKYDQPTSLIMSAGLGHCTLFPIWTEAS